MNRKEIAELLYGHHHTKHSSTVRLGSAQLGAVVLRLDTGTTMPACWMGELGRLGWSYGAAGGVEAGLGEIPDGVLDRQRIVYLPRGRALGLYITK